jgi:hypothetical protein
MGVLEMAVFASISINICQSISMIFLLALCLLVFVFFRLCVKVFVCSLPVKLDVGSR